MQEGVAMSKIVFEGICRDLTNEGKGIVDYKGSTVFVPDLLLNFIPISPPNVFNIK